MTPQRRLGSSVVGCLAGAALALYGATRVWSVQVTERPGLTSLRSTTTGADAAPWLIGLALVALAGAGALLATRGLSRRLLGALLTIVGAGLVIAAVAGRAGLEPGAAGAGATFWPVMSVLGGGLVGWGGVSAARHGHRWPSMGSRYERRPVQPAPTRSAADSPPPAAGGLTPGPDPAQPGGKAGPGKQAGSDGAGSDGLNSAAEPKPAGPDQPATDDQSATIASVDTRAAWDALDRGDDPTTS